MKGTRLTATRKVVAASNDSVAVCFIFDGIKYQDYCRRSSFNESACLEQFPSHLAGLLDQDVSNESRSQNNELVRYQPTGEVDFPKFAQAIGHYWIEVCILCVITALLLNFVYVKFVKRFQKKQSPLKATTSTSGITTIGKISFDTSKIIGRGSRETVVYEGKFEDTLKCAVKKITVYSKRAELEIEFLRTLSNSQYLVKYFATESDDRFVYIALNLAEYTLADVIEKNLSSCLGEGLSKTELCRQTALGLQHLHKLGIAHRDLKPQNILVSFPDKASRERTVLISDFGLSKYLESDTMNSRTTYAPSYGTYGWMAPEVLKANLANKKESVATKSSDIFSLGCVFYYIFSDGQHPFGRQEDRNINIFQNQQCMQLFTLNDSNTIDNLNEELAVMATHMITAMISFIQDKRPPIDYILKHPLFWSRGTQLNFLMDFSDLIDKNQASELARRIERQRQRIISYDWMNLLDEELQADVKRFRSYQVSKIRDLLRVIRNKRHHYNESSEVVKKNLGDIPDGLTSYFTKRFPRLLPHIYSIGQEYRHHSLLKNYYEQIADSLEEECHAQQTSPSFDWPHLFNDLEELNMTNRTPTKAKNVNIDKCLIGKDL